MNIINEWNSKTGAEQLSFCRACVVKVADREFGVKELFHHGNEIDDYANAVYIKLAETLTPAHVSEVNQERAHMGKPQITLRSMVYRAARAVLASEIRKSQQQQARDGGELDTVNEWREAAHDSTDSIILHIDLEQFRSSRDAADQRILELVIEGYTEREIAAEIAISNVAVHKRIVKMRNELVKAIA